MRCCNVWVGGGGGGGLNVLLEWVGGWVGGWVGVTYQEALLVKEATNVVDDLRPNLEHTPVLGRSGWVGGGWVVDRRFP